MTNEQELRIANEVWACAWNLARDVSQPQDHEAATVAALMAALVLATLDLSAERRASLFLGDE